MSARKSKSEATELVKIRFQRFRQGIREKVEV